MFGIGVVRLFIKRRQWRKLNSHNFTVMGLEFSPAKVKVGRHTYGLLNVVAAGGVNSAKLYIGSFCSIALGVKFILSGEHNMNTISSFPFRSLVVSNKPFLIPESLDKGNIVIHDDVWIGSNAIICGGVHIGQGAVIAAGAVVTKDVPPYAVVGGVPAKVIKYRFSEEMIKELMKVDYSKLTDEMIVNHIDELYSPLNEVKQLDWLPKKAYKNIQEQSVENYEFVMMHSGGGYECRVKSSSHTKEAA